MLEINCVAIGIEHPSDIRGAKIESQTKVTVTNSPQVFEWKGYGLMLIIPPQSLPSGLKSCELVISASMLGQYQFPINTALVSPVFWLKCRPMCEFKFPPTLVIQHCAPLKNQSHLSIVRASCTQRELPYTFRVLDGAIFKENDGVISLNHFSGIAVLQSDSEERMYWSQLYYMNNSPNIRCKDIHVAVTWCDDAHIRVSLSIV